MSERWIEVADRVFVRRHTELDLSLGLIMGDLSCVVVDTGGDIGQGTGWADTIRAVTSLPWQVVLTHSHFDHSFGTGAFLPCPVWAHPGCRDELMADGAAQRSTWAARYRAQGKDEIAERIAATTLVMPDKLVSSRTELDLGGRFVVLDSFGTGHTDHDLVVHVPDVDVLFTGDLVENGAPPAFEGSSPATWPDVLTHLLDLIGPDTTVVPGHGEPVGARFVAAQRASIASVAELGAAVLAGELSEAAALRRSPFPAEPTLTAMRALTARNRSAG